MPTPAQVANNHVRTRNAFKPKMASSHDLTSGSEDAAHDTADGVLQPGTEAHTSKEPEQEGHGDERPHTPERHLEPGPEEDVDEDIENTPPHSTLSHRFRDSPRETRGLSVLVSAPARPWEYQPLQGATTVGKVLEETPGPAGTTWYRIEYEDDTEDTVSLEKLLQLRNGQNALNFFNDAPDDSNDSNDPPSAERNMSDQAGKRLRARPCKARIVDSSHLSIDTDSDEQTDKQAITKKRRLEKGRVSLLTNNSTRQSSRVSSRVSSRISSRPPQTIHDEESTESESDGLRPAKRSSGRLIKTRIKLNPAAQSDDDADELAGLVQFGSDDGSDVVYRRSNHSKRSTRQGKPQATRGRGRPRKYASSSASPERAEPSRRSGRDRVVKNMKERDMDEEMYADDGPTKNTPKVLSIREIYQPVPKNDRFALFHNKSCDICSGVGSNSNKGTSPLIHCQGCSTSIHKVCLGYRSTRDHAVTKVGHENFVLQCRRCIGLATKKDPSAPHLDTCQECKKPGPACKAFAPKKTTKQEEKSRQENDGDDPITEVPETLVNNAENVLFRCISCYRAYHFDHLPGLNISKNTEEELGTSELREKRLKEYTPTWQCKDCYLVPAKVQTLVAWRPANRESYKKGQTVFDFDEDDKEYLVKWTELSYFKSTWMPGAWVWGVTAAAMRKAFVNRDEGVNELPKWTNEEAVPEEYLRMEIVFSVRYDDEFEQESEADDKASINMVQEVLVKFQGLGYDEAVWEEPPKPSDEARWSDFVSAYNEYVAGRYLKQPPVADMKERQEKFRSLNFEKKVELKKQPSALTGGQMMPYQMEGLNWLLYNFHQKKNVILADEMGLGKTIQLIAFMASLAKDNPRCWPFLVVTPNSTCPNWRREIKKWAPSLRVVAYYGAKKARDMAMEYELYPDGCSDLRAHVVVTSYEAPVDDYSKSFFRRIKWAGMIVDEGQRLKNDENLLYIALKALKVPFQVLLTGTPLQNNKRELFNLLQFLDTSINAADMDEKYAELTKENLPELHELIRPFFLRRTKLQVLKFLPPMAQVILPVSMSVVQKKLYKSILARSPELIKSILGQSSTVLKPKERGNLNNILMQLRKCLCHPFLYSSAIEEVSKTDTAEDVHSKLVEASSKFQLLKIMLPKLRDRGHRVLLFSQFLMQLDLVEDFLNGLGLPFQRLDGTVGSLEKQRRIDAFNAPDSELFAFLLSTRAGGVGINLATADTVIIMDPDFNPHQDIQALSRAHRIGQKKKVLVFQLMTKDSAEEKIVQIGRKKMALDQALIESMGAEDDAGVDLESILRHGAQALFADDDRNDIRYDSDSVDKLLDRTQVENTDPDDEKTAESQFSFARVWANDKGTLTDDVGDDNSDDAPPDTSLWEKILKQREADAAAEAARDAQTFGRGKRARQTVTYRENENNNKMDIDDPSPVKPSKKKPNGSASDIDYQSAAETEIDEDSDAGLVALSELQTKAKVTEPFLHSPISATVPSQGQALQDRTSQQSSAPIPHPPITSTIPSQGRAFQDGTSQQNRAPFPPSHQQPSFAQKPSSQAQSQVPQWKVGHNPSAPGYGPQASNHLPASAYGVVSGPHPHEGGLTRSFNPASQNQNQTQGQFQQQQVIQPPNGYGNAHQLAGSAFGRCPTCRNQHAEGQCAVRARTTEECGYCGIAHFSFSKKCPFLCTEAQIRILIDTLDRESQEPAPLVKAAKDALLGELAGRRRMRDSRALVK
ncbi:hypothetical protein LZ554_007320 [Drepanopeziza brunnea f. sp. 'monogermtubi']|nr:hypothetical protein LZ554_007320 [Drepanopeziza brunnea f. sp. 'monogermtubi']